jgi:hypothetical protein
MVVTRWTTTSIIASRLLLRIHGVLGSRCTTVTGHSLRRLLLLLLRLLSMRREWATWTTGLRGLRAGRRSTGMLLLLLLRRSLRRRSTSAR